MDSGGYQTLSGLCENLLKHGRSRNRINQSSFHWHTLAVRPSRMDSLLVCHVVDSNVGQTGSDVASITGSGLGALGSFLCSLAVGKFVINPTSMVLAIVIDFALVGLCRWLTRFGSFATPLHVAGPDLVLDAEALAILAITTRRRGCGGIGCPFACCRLG